MRGPGAGTVRIVAGTMRGRRLRVPARGEVRPTSEMVREALFDALGPVTGMRVLDLFAGTGALGLEALSRGARDCTFVEDDRAVGSSLRGNIAALGYGNVCRVLIADYRRAVDTLMRSDKPFDLLFVDPPYRILAEVEETLTPLVSCLLSSGGVMVIEGPRAMAVTFGRSVIFGREYGDTRITMVRQKE